ncbi:tetratricopeptide repeat-containing protein EMW1 [Ascoidea rubescens DSM 1968]|uniref:TPR-like protein n=1 Tax=Ascoidea rubescens DSM 1968 TaxID=1344418 RepID=A0A1D2VGQ4_9ASCO|nr:TPR-like protein [Ascoidea rubescens DSM 1968]ODV60815.1 TPR-like protein [Ascoidea rubescens DSM 1968]
MNNYNLGLLHSYLLILSPFQSFKALFLDGVSNVGIEKSLIEPISLILKGQSNQVLSLEIFKDLLFDEELIKKKVVLEFGNDTKKQESDDLNQNEKLLKKHLILIFAVSLLQLFLQLNFTGPKINEEKVSETVNQFFKPIIHENDKLADQISEEISKSLNLNGQFIYELTNHPFLLLFSLHLLEKLSLTEKSLLISKEIDAESLSTSTLINNNRSEDSDNVLLAASNWWRSRALQVHMSLFFEISGPHVVVSSLLLNKTLLDPLIHEINRDNIAENKNNELIKNLYARYYLEKVRSYLQAETESLCLNPLDDLNDITGFQMALTGAKAKRTKYQEKSIASLILLALSSNEDLFDDSHLIKSNDNTIENFKLNSDYMLERPKYEEIGDKTLIENFNQNSVDSETSSTFFNAIPLLLESGSISEDLRNLDPNNQPRLNDLDNIQLLLRLAIVRQTSPSKDPLAEEELLSIVQRILFTSEEDIKTNGSKTNWLIFSKCLWERSLIESTKSKTLERGILQMEALVEELGMSMNHKYIPEIGKNNKDEQDSDISAERLRFVYQLPLLPRWAMDVELAEKYMSVGLIKSSIEIYERLKLTNDLALCYMSIGQEKNAEKLLLERIEKKPDDARPYSILGDIRQDTTLWFKAWEVGKYSNAKISLGKYYYYNKKHKDLAESMKHLKDALAINPLKKNNWFFYGCVALEALDYETAAQAFTRSVAIDDTQTFAWSNLSSALANLNKNEEALSALQKAVRSIKDSNKSGSKLWENYLIISSRLQKWNHVLIAVKQLSNLKKDSLGEKSVDLPVVQKLVEVLVEKPYPTNENEKLTFFQKDCIQYVCNDLPKLITTSTRLWKVVAKVELWRKKPWECLACYEKAFRAVIHDPNLSSEQDIWNKAVECCEDLVASYESLGELPGKYGADDVVCKNWRYKSKSSIRSLMSKGKRTWEDSDGWERLTKLKEHLGL